MPRESRYIDDDAPPRGRQIDIVSAVVEIGVMLVGVALSGWMLSKIMDPHKEEKKRGQDQIKRMKKFLRRDDIELNSHEMVVVSELVNPDDLDVSLADVGGLNSEKQRLMSLIVEPLRSPPMFKRSTLLSMPRGVLLYGPPGTGKTMMAKALAKESGAWFINAKGSLLLNKFYGESQKLVNALFTLAQKLSPCVIFIDEVDALLGRRNEMEQEHNTQLKTEFMQMWDGFSQTEHYDVVVMGATNRPWALDDAILRRFSVQVEVPLPTTRDRAKILHKILATEKRKNPEIVGDELVSGDLPSDAVQDIARKTEGFSGSQLKDLCQEAARVWMSEWRQSLIDPLDMPGSSAGARTVGNMYMPPIQSMSRKHFESVLATNRVRKGTDAAEIYKVKTSKLNGAPATAAGRSNGRAEEANGTHGLDVLGVRPATREALENLLVSLLEGEL